MKTFTDLESRVWNVSITVDTVKRVRTLIEVDLDETANGKLIQQLSEDPVLLCDVLYCIIKPQADERQISDEAFGRAMAGDVIDQATMALLEGLVDFLPSRKRQRLQKVLEKLKKLESVMDEVIDKRLASSDLEDQVRTTMESQSQVALDSVGNSSGSLQASSE